MPFRLPLLALFAAAAALAEGPLDRAYEALRARRYDQAIREFRAAIAAAPAAPAVHQDLAYTYLKTGETEAARDSFAEAMRLDPANEHAALEYAFLCFETKQQAEARRIFDRLRRRGNGTAERAFQRIDSELAEGIARWSRAVELSPHSFSAHQELARLAERRDDLAVAAEHYGRAWRLRPDLRSFLLDLGRVWQMQGDAAQAHAALLAASRGAEPRVAEAARELLPERYPYVYEFRKALDLDPGNLPLRRELAYLHLEMGQAPEAENEFRRIVAADAEDALSAAQLGFLLLSRKDAETARPLLERALADADRGSEDELADRIRAALGLPQTLRKRPDVPRPQTSSKARVLAERSLAAGYMKDALKYLRIAHENDPVDFNVMLNLGWTYNLLGDDRQAVEWFRLARQNPENEKAAEAARAYSNLRPAFARFRTTTWALPMYSTRWKDLFTYAQVKTELMPGKPVQLYLSTRFSGDARRSLGPSVAGAESQYLSESAAIFAAGISTRTWRGVRAWMESGAAVSYLRREDSRRVRADHRGGLSAVRGFGSALGGERSGVHAELSGDAVYMSRFDRDGLFYGRVRAGYTFRPAGPLQLQAAWLTNLSSDTRRFQWANAAETGPGLRLHLRGTPQPLLFSIDAVRGRYTVLDGTRPPRYTDVRVSIWYAFSR